MKVDLFKGLVPLNLQPKKDAKNAADNSARIQPDDHLYMLDDLQHLVGPPGSTEILSHEYRLRQLEAVITAQITIINNLSGIALDSGHQTITAYGLTLVNLHIDAPSNQYRIIAFIIDNDGSRRDAVPQISPPLMEMRTTTEFYIDSGSDNGELYWEIRL